MSEASERVPEKRNNREEDARTPGEGEGRLLFHPHSPSRCGIAIT